MRPKRAELAASRGAHLYSDPVGTYARPMAAIRNLGAMAAGIGVLTGLGTLVGWALSASFIDAASVALVVGAVLSLTAGPVLGIRSWDREEMEYGFTCTRSNNAAGRSQITSTCRGAATGRWWAAS
jgi:hypothetical protein